ncbi:MAG: shikimate dehydrogenase [Actinomycetales bacterium]
MTSPNDAAAAEAVTRRAAVLGSPIAHSKSPLLHRAAYQLLGLTAWRYEAIEVGEDELGAFVAGLDPSWAGLSLTMPLKKAILPLLDETDPLAAEVGAVNTVVFRWPHEPAVVAGGADAGAVGAEQSTSDPLAPYLVGYNTDVPGLVAALRDAGVGHDHRALVLGAGATAASALRALVDLDCRQAGIVCRRPEAVEALAALASPHGLKVTHVSWDAPLPTRDVGVVVSTLPAAAAEALVPRVPSAPDEAPPLFDVAYDPWPTPLASAWTEAGGAVTGGLELLLHQAALQVPLMTGAAVPPDQLVTAMRSVFGRSG